MEKEKKNKKQVIIGISILLLVTLLLLGLTYAYYRTRIIGNTNSESISVTAENLSVTYHDGTSTLTTSSVEPGDNFTKSFSVENTGDAKASYSIILDNKVNEFTRNEDWKYKLYEGTDTTGEPIASGTIAAGSEQILYGKAEVNEKETDNYILQIEYVYLADVNQSEDMNKSLSFRVNIGEEKVTWDNAEEGTLLNAIKTNISGMQDTPQTTPGLEQSEETEKVLAETEDDYGISHYFRGNVDNNYLNFGNMCWRIVRVQGDGSIKIVLADRENTCESANFSEDTKNAFIAIDTNEVKSYTYNDYNLQYKASDLPSTLSAWLNGGESEYMDLTSYAKTKGTFKEREEIDKTKLVEAEWCNDMSIVKEELDEFGSTTTFYGSSERLGDYTASVGTGPSLKCNFTGLKESKAEKYVSNIGVLSADEVAFAGSTYDSSLSAGKDNYLRDGANDSWWTMSPGEIQNSTSPTVYIVNTKGALTVVYTYFLGEGFANPIRPALVLKSDVQVASEGNGTQSSPYKIN